MLVSAWLPWFFSMQVGESHAALVTRPSLSFAQGMYGASVQSDGFVHFEGKSEFHGVLFEKGCTVGVGLDVVQVINSTPSTLNSSLVRQESERHTTQRPTNLHALSFPPGPNPNFFPTSQGYACFSVNGARIMNLVPGPNPKECWKVPISRPFTLVAAASLFTVRDKSQARLSFNFTGPFEHLEAIKSEGWDALADER